MDWSVIWGNIDFLAGGLVVTFELAAISLVGGLGLGTLVAVARLSSKARFIGPSQRTSTSFAEFRLSF